MEKYGFVYIWRDRKHNRYYIGSHWGFEDDGYICSSSWMKKSYKHRQHDFFRKVISRVKTKEELLNEEHKWLSMIKKEELGKKYYNLKNTRFGHWMEGKDSLTIREKIKAKRAEQEITEGMLNSLFEYSKKPKSEKTKKKMSEAHLGKVLSEETKEKVRQANIGKKYSEETNKKKGRSKTYRIISPEGNEIIINGLTKFCQENNLNPTAMLDTASGRIKQHRGWQCQKFI